MIVFAQPIYLTGQNILQVATHEIGHALGLFHSKNIGAVMYPYATSYTKNLTLHDDDIRGIQEIYGNNN